LPVAIIGAAVVISIAMNLLKPPPLKAESPNTALVVKTQLLQAADANLAVQSQGTVLPRTRTLLTSEVAGTVLQVSPQFVVGGTFNAGDLLLQIDPSDYKVALQRAKANLISMNAQLTFERARATQAEKEWAMTGRPAEEAPLLALRKPYLEEARANVLQAEAEVTQAQLKLERTAIRVPYTGMVSTKAVDIGQYVSVGTHLGETFAIDFAEVRLPLTKRDLSMMNNFSQVDREHHLQVTLLGSAHGNEKRWDARLVRSEGVIDKVNRSLYVVAQVDDPYARNSGDRTNASPLLMGTFVTAIIGGKSIANVFAVPRHVLLEGSKIALVDDDQRLRLKSVEPIYADKQFYYLSHDIDKGIEDGAEIIVSTIGVPIEGMKVAPERIELAAIVTKAPKAQGALFDGE
jgi:RND family efflux transporter MFP subunit